MSPQKKGAELISYVEKITPEIKKAAEGKSQLGRGGMKTKLEAAEIASKSGIPLVIANSRKTDVLLSIIKGEKEGTFFKPAEKKLSSIKKWIAYGAGVKGQIYINPGAQKAIIKGASLLAVGIENVTGRFQVGDVIGLINFAGKEFARGIVNYSGEEISIIKGLKTNQIKKTLGYIRQKEIIIRKNICLMEKKEKNE
jgi:glutamate 5-kinase